MTNHRSVSQMFTYSSCPRKYNYSYVDKKESMGESTGLVFGSAIHKAQEFNYRQKIESRVDRPYQEVEDFMVEYLIQKFKDNADNPNFFKLKYGKRESGEDIIASAKRCLKKLYDEVMTKLQPAYVEIGVTLDIFGQEFLMYLDVIDENDIIHDTKTSGSSYSEEDIEKNTQLAAYALGFRTKFGRKEKGVQLDVVVKTKEPKIQILKAEITDEKISRLLNTLESINRGIEQKIFHPVDNGMVCSWCDFRDACEADNNLPDAKVFAERLAKIVEIKKDNLEKI